jgi:hypothetical protein
MTKPIPTMTTAAEIKKDVYGRRRDFSIDDLREYAKALLAQGHTLVEQGWDQYMSLDGMGGDHSWVTLQVGPDQITIRTSREFSFTVMGINEWPKVS